MAGEIIRQGDPTSHHGTVLEGSMTDICFGKPIAFIGHRVHCPKCGGDFPIVEGVLTTTFYGKGVAIAGMKTSCGAVLIPTQFTDIVEYGAGAAGAAASTTQAAAPAAAAAVAAAAVAAAAGPGAAAEQPAPDKAIKRVYWSYGASETPLDEVSRHVVDLNVHVETEHYAPGETVDVTLRNDDGTDLIEGTASLQLQAVVGDGGVATIRDVFKGKTVQIGRIG
jgi:uncharacterized Zn-binding protein involved in type VI secretion